jgi:hypothetical protein
LLLERVDEGLGLLAVRTAHAPEDTRVTA